MNKSLCYFTIVVLMTLYACEDPTTIGSGLLEEEEISLNSQSDFDISSTTFQPDPIPVYIRNSSNFTIFNIGKYTDPIFGEVSSKAVLRVEYNFNLDIPNLSSIYIDSVVLAIAYDSTGGYGNKDILHDIKVFEASEFPITDTILSNLSLPVIETPLGASTRKFAPKDSVTIQDYLADTVFRKAAPQLRISLDTSRFLSLFSDFESVNTSAELVGKLKGFVISSDPQGNGLMGLNMGTTTSDATSGLNGLYIYYRTKSNNTRTVAKLILSLQKYNLPTIGFQNSPFGSALGSAEIGKERLFVQGLGGPNVKLRFDDINELKGKVINHAELEIAAETLSGDDKTLYPYANQLILSYQKDNSFVTISDITDLSSPGIAIEAGFGGTLLSRSGTPNGTYKMVVTKAIKAMLNGQVPNNELIVSPLLSAQRPGRVVLYGAKHPQYPIKLKVAYTNP